MEKNEEYWLKFKSSHSNLMDALDDAGIESELLSKKIDTHFVEQHYSEIEADLLQFYAFFSNGYHCYWKYDHDADHNGSLNIWPIEELFNEKNLVQLDGEETRVNVDANTKHKLNLKGVFRKVDYFVDEEHVGFFSDPSMKFHFYYMDSDQEFWDLKLDFKGYFELACAARCYTYWHQAILFREFKKSYMQSGSDNFIESMPQIFPDFKIDDFFSLYDSLKLKD